MAVQPQTPYIEHIANGTTTGFNLGFDCDDQDHLIVLVNDVEPVVGSWSLTGGAVVFGAAPTSGNKITIQRNTPFERKRDYQSYDNSFRPPVVNKDFDWIWLKLQELGVADWILGSRITALKNYVDRKDDELRAYLMEEIRKQGVALDQLDEYYNYLMQRLAQIAVDKGWDASFVVDGNENQHQINNSLIRIVLRKSDLLNINQPKNNQVVYVVENKKRYIYNSGLVSAENGVTIIGKWEMEVQEAYYASWFCPDSSIDNVNEPQEDNINAGYRYAASKGRPFIIDKPYYVDSKIARTTQTFPALNGFRDSSTNFAIRIQSNSILAFQHEGELKLKPTAAAYGAILMVFDVENYIILDPKLTGDKDTHLVTTGEQHHGIHLAASKNGYIRNPVIKEMWGDGIYLGFMFWVKPFIDVYVPTNVVIDNPRLLNISRNGVSLCGAENLTINNLYVEDVNRVAPLAGVDIEPEEDINFTEKMFIKNAVFHNSTFIGCGYAISQNIFGNRDVEVSFTGITNIVNKGSKTSWIPMLLQSRYLEDNTELNYKQNGYLNIDHVIVSDLGSNLAFKYLAQVDIPENSIKVRIKHYEFTSTNIIPQLMFLNSGVVSAKSSGFSVDKFTFNNQVNYVDFVFSSPTTAKPKINYNLNFDESLNIQYQNKGFEFYGSCHVGGWSLVSTPLWDEKSHINNVLFIPSDNGSGAITSYGTVTNKNRDVFYSLSPKGSDHSLGLTVISEGFVKRSTTDGASIRLVNMNDPAGTKIKSIYGNWIS